jgi:hypothetical protein
MGYSRNAGCPASPGVIDACYRAYARAKGKTDWGDKAPGNMLRTPTLLRWFPDAQFLHIVRDGRDACLSQLKQDFGFDDCLMCGFSWREEVWWVRQLGEMMGPDRYWEVHYEDLIANAEMRLRDICACSDLNILPPCWNITSFSKTRYA